LASIEVAGGAQTYNGVNRRKHRRIEAKYPICVTFVSRHGTNVERYAETRNVSSAGVLIGPLESVPAGTKVDMQMGIPSGNVFSVPSAQLNCAAVVVRSEPIDTDEDTLFQSRVALRFVEKPKITTKVTMFD
jgi:hypothetical protein